MILAAAAAACAVAGAAGFSYIFDNNEKNESIDKTYETVTVSSTILDKQGVVRCVIHPYSSLYPSLIQPKLYKSTYGVIHQNKLNQWNLPMKIDQQKFHEYNFKQNLSIIFFWSMPLKAHLLQIPTKLCSSFENLNIYERKSIRISIGIQHDINENMKISDASSEIILSNLEEYDHTFDSLSFYNPISNNDDVIPIGILKKKKLNTNQSNSNHKRFCYDKMLDLHQEISMRNIILKNVNLCVDNLSKILNESCSNNEKASSTLRDSISYSSNNNKLKRSIEQDIYSQLLKDEEHLNQKHISLTNNNNNNNNINITEQLSDGIILHRGQQYGKTLGEPMIRKYDENEEICPVSFHSIDILNRLLSKANCLLMRQYKIESIENLIRLFLEQGEENFTKIMIHVFKVNSSIVEQINEILIDWARQLT